MNQNFVAFSVTGEQFGKVAAFDPHAVERDDQTVPTVSGIKKEFTADGRFLVSFSVMEKRYELALSGKRLDLSVNDVNGCL